MTVLRMTIVIIDQSGKLVKFICLNKGNQIEPNGWYSTCLFTKWYLTKIFLTFDSCDSCDSCVCISCSKKKDVVA